jgi:hypothetical protein
MGDLIAWLVGRLRHPTGASKLVWKCTVCRKNSTKSTGPSVAENEQDLGFRFVCPL